MTSLDDHMCEFQYPSLDMIASLVLYHMILQKTLVMCFIASFTLLNSLMPMYILYIVFICSIVLYVLWFVEGHLVDWLI